MRFCLLAAGLLFLASGCHRAGAQILNVEKTRIKGDSANYFVGNVGVNFSINNRNLSDTGEGIYFIGLVATSDVGYLAQHTSYFLLSQFQYNATSEQDINSTGYGHFRTTFRRKQPLSYETFAQLQYDQGRGMVLRGLIGGNIRLRIYEAERSNLYVGIGAMREREDWEVPSSLVTDGTSTVRSINIWKSTNYLVTNVSLNEFISFNAIAYFQTGYDPQAEFFRHRLSLDTNVLVKVTARLALSTYAGFTYENHPIVPITKLVYSVTNGIQLSF